MTDTRDALDLSALETDYEIVGELNGPCDARSYMATRKDASAKRRDDNSAVLITVITTPKGDEGNALSHLAADTKTLAGTSHRRLVPVIEGRWIAKEAFAVVTQRITDPTLAERLASGETFSTPRIAAILREVNGLLEWARDNRIVHRNVTADRILLETKTDRVRLSLSAVPIPRIQHSDAAADDARTIARLAVTMLTASEDPNACEGGPVGALREDLPQKLRDATTALLDEKAAHTPADVAAYLALIGMADPLFSGETEEKRIRAEILEEQRAEREKLAAERAEFERVMADERATFERTIADERASFKAAMEEEHRQLDAERAALEGAVAAERAKLQREVTDERAALATTRAELEQATAIQRAELERVALEDRRRIDALRAELQRAGELEIEKKRLVALNEITDEESTLERDEFATPFFVPPAVARLKSLEFSDTPLMREDDVAFPATNEASATGAPVTTAEAVLPDSGPSRKQWMVTGALVGVGAIIAVSAIALGNRHNTTPPPPRTVAPQSPTTPPLASVVPLPVPAQVVDSLGGNVARSLDSAAVAAAPPAPKPKPKPKKIVRDTSSVADSTLAPGDSAVRDSLAAVRRAARTRRDSTARRDSAARRDSLARPDTTRNER